RSSLESRCRPISTSRTQPPCIRLFLNKRPARPKPQSISQQSRPTQPRLKPPMQLRLLLYFPDRREKPRRAGPIHLYRIGNTQYGGNLQPIDNPFLWKPGRGVQELLTEPAFDFVDRPPMRRCY